MSLLRRARLMILSSTSVMLTWYVTCIIESGERSNAMGADHIAPEYHRQHHHHRCQRNTAGISTHNKTASQSITRLINRHTTRNGPRERRSLIIGHAPTS